jgi:hypothetical protein
LNTIARLELVDPDMQDRVVEFARELSGQNSAPSATMASAERAAARSARAA